MDAPAAVVRPPAPRRRIGVGAAIVLVLLAACVAVIIGLVRSASAPVEVVPTANVNIADADGAGGAVIDEATLYVHVSGSVAAPGLYRLVEGARVVDAVAAAGGMTAEADPAAINLARRLSDAEQLHVPAVGEQPESGAAGPGGSGPASDGRVNINTADAAALDTLPRIGPALAQRILDWRDAHGRFSSVEDLLAVPGIGEKMLEALRDLVTL